MTRGQASGETALMYGENESGGEMSEENVVSDDGKTWWRDEEKLCHRIRDAGFMPAKRDNAYNILTIHRGDEAPDRCVEDWSLLTKDRLVAHTDEPEAVTLTVGQL